MGIGLCKVCGKGIKNYDDHKRKRCGACNTKIRRIRNKWAAINLLGCKCMHCGWIGSEKEMAAYEFHHFSGKKDFTIGNMSNKSWLKIKTELLRCKLLCSRCHRIEHSDRDESILEEAFKKYQGANQDLYNKSI